MENKTKSNSYRTQQKRTINGTKDVYNKKTPKQGTCPKTGETLKGVPRRTAKENANSSKSSKRPERPYGGALSSKAARKIHVQKARNTEL